MVKLKFDKHIDERKPEIQQWIKGQWRTLKGQIRILKTNINRTEMKVVDEFEQ